MQRTFIDHLNHEIRSPLTVVVGMSELFSLSPLSDEQRHWLRTMQQAVTAVLRLMDGAVDFSRLSANRLALRAGPFQLSGVLADMRERLSLGSPSVELEASVAAEVPDRLIGDAERLRQALLGLAEHLAVVRGARRLGFRVALSASPPSDKEVALEFLFGESGRSLESAVGEHERPGEFIACSEAVVDRRRGLELAVAAGLAGAMHGSVWIATENDAAVAGRLAAKFGLSADDASFGQALAGEFDAGPPPAPDAGGPKRILLADDDRAARQLLVSLLERHGHFVASASNGREALDILEREVAAQRPFDAVILDLEMPIMNGWQAAQEIRGRDWPRPVRVLALTAHRTEGSLDLLGSGVFDAALEKPVDARRLLEVIGCCEAAAADEIPRLAETAGDCLVDYAGALTRLCGDESLLNDLVRFFLDDAPNMLSEARAAIERSDAKTLERTAHGIRGLASNFGAQPAMAAAAALEELARNAALHAADAACNELEAEVRRLMAVLELRVESIASGRGGARNS